MANKRSDEKDLERELDELKDLLEHPDTGWKLRKEAEELSDEVGATDDTQVFHIVDTYGPKPNPTDENQPPCPFGYNHSCVVFTRRPPTSRWGRSR